MAWSDSTQKRLPPMMRREGGYVTFGATSLTVNIYTFISKINHILHNYRSSGNSCVFDSPLTASATKTQGYFVLTRPSTGGGASTVWYEVIGQ